MNLDILCISRISLNICLISLLRIILLAICNAFRLTIGVKATLLTSSSEGIFEWNGSYNVLSFLFLFSKNIFCNSLRASSSHLARLYHSTFIHISNHRNGSTTKPRDPLSINNRQSTNHRYNLSHIQHTDFWFRPA